MFLFPKQMKLSSLVAYQLSEVAATEELLIL
jgi:predicted DNA-binding transcriptional regulator AlpA